MPKKKNICVVCGRKFPEGQGVVIDVYGIKLIFHSKACALKFMRNMLQRIDENPLKQAVNNTIEEFSEKLKEHMKMKAKRL